MKYKGEKKWSKVGYGNFYKNAARKLKKEQKEKESEEKALNENKDEWKLFFSYFYKKKLESN